MFRLDYSDLRHILCEMLLIVALGVVVGLSANIGLLQRVISGQGAPPAVSGRNDAATRYPEPADLDQARRAVADRTTLVIDARIGELYRDGHLPGAVSLPLAKADRRLPRLQDSVPPDRPLLVYCSGYGCPDSFDLAMKLLAAGYRRVMVFEGGFPEWRDAGLPVETGGGTP